MDTPIIRQTQAAECGLACLAMVAGHHGQHIDLNYLRRRFSVSLKGVDLHQLVRYASNLGLSARPVRIDLTELKDLQLPCVLHWGLNHFVVLTKVDRGSAVILDPAIGEKRVSRSQLSRYFTGVAVELTPNSEFKTEAPAPRVRLSQLTGRVKGLGRALGQIFAVALVLQLAAVAAPLFNQFVVDDVIASYDTDLLVVLVFGFALLLVFQTALGLLRSWMVMVLGQSLSLGWLGNVFNHLVHLPVDWFERRHLGDVVSRFSSIHTIQRTLTTSVIEAVLDGLMAVVALGMMLLYSVPLALVALGAVAAYGVVRWASYSPLREASIERLELSAKENTHFLETIRAITPLRLFGKEDERRAQWQNLIVDVQNQDVRTARLSIYFSTANTFIFGLENLLVFWLGAKYVMQGQLGSGPAFTIGMLFAFVSYKSQFTGRVSALINYGVQLKMLSLHGERLADIALSPRERMDQPDHSLDHLKPSIELWDVSFRYGDGEPWILRNVNLKIDAGDSAALVGASGCGKTTLLKILLGVLPPSEGKVLYGGVPIEQLGTQNVRRCIGTVMQEDVLLTGSIAENISFFSSKADRLLMESCAKWANVHDDISRMPMGYHTLTGDLGSGLSGGQRQRILLARALYKRPAVLALDEATSHLDVGSERSVTRELAQMNMTRIIIAHRPETIAGARRVLQLREGRVEEVLRAVPAANVAAPNIGAIGQAGVATS